MASMARPMAFAIPSSPGVLIRSTSRVRSRESPLRRSKVETEMVIVGPVGFRTIAINDVPRRKAVWMVLDGADVAGSDAGGRTDGAVREARLRCRNRLTESVLPWGPRATSPATAPRCPPARHRAPESPGTPDIRPSPPERVSWALLKGDARIMATAAQKI